MVPRLQELSSRFQGSRYPNESQKFQIHYFVLPLIWLDNLASEIKKALLKAAIHAIPKSRNIKTKKNNYPTHIVYLIRHKRKLAYYFKSNRTEQNGENLKACEIECGSAIREFNQSQWMEFLKKMVPSPLSSITFWRRINRLRGNKRSNNVANLVENGINYTKRLEFTKDWKTGRHTRKNIRKRRYWWFWQRSLLPD